MDLCRQTLDLMLYRCHVICRTVARWVAGESLNVPSTIKVYISSFAPTINRRISFYFLHHQCTIGTQSSRPTVDSQSRGWLRDGWRCVNFRIGTFATQRNISLSPLSSSLSKLLLLSLSLLLKFQYQLGSDNCCGASF